VHADGFKELEKTGLVLRASERLSAGTLTLAVGTVMESIEVTAETTPVQTASQERSWLLNDKQMETLMARGRDFMGLLRVLPDVVGGGGGETLGTSGMPSINGVRNEYNLATIDGVVGNTRGLDTLDTPLNLDAIAEVKVLSANYQAEYGKTAGSVITVVSKQGTRNFHVIGYYYLRNEALNAMPMAFSTTSTAWSRLQPDRATATTRSAATSEGRCTGPENSTPRRTSFLPSSPKSIYPTCPAMARNIPSPRLWNAPETSPKLSISARS